MSIKNVKEFYQKLLVDEALQEKLKKMETSNFADRSTPLTKEERIEATKKLLIPLAHDEGFDFTVEDIMEYEKSFNQELTSDELNSITGGTWVRGALACAILGVGFGVGNQFWSEESSTHAVDAFMDLFALPLSTTCFFIGIGAGYKIAGYGPKSKNKSKR